MFSTKGQKGFTFLEVMAAIVVISLMSLTAVSLVKNSSTEFIRVNMTRRAYELAQEKLYEIVEDSNLGSYAGSSGVFEGVENKDFSWTSEMSESNTKGVRVLEVKVKNSAVNVNAVLNYVYYSSN